MTGWFSARRLGLTAAGTTVVAGTGAGLTTWLLRHQAALARRRVSAHTEVVDPPSGEGVWGDGPGETRVLAMLGDSTAVGRGVAGTWETPGVLLAVTLSDLTDSPVRLVVAARSGSGAAALAAQVEQVLAVEPDVAVIMTGTNDVTARRPHVEVAAALGAAVRTLIDAGVPVVVGTCPDLGTLRPVPQPLRRLGRRWSRQLAAAQTVAVVEAGGRSVSMGSLLGPEFASRPEYFSPDEFHPSATGYARAAATLLPSVADAVGVPAPAEVRTLPTAGRAARPIEWAAARAAVAPGTEVTAADDPRPRLLEPDRSFARTRRRSPADLSEPGQPATG